MSEPVGRKRWAIAEGHIPSLSNSDETACILNAADQEAHVEITVYYSDREPVGPYRITVPARRTLHQRFNELKGPKLIPEDTDFASVIESDVPIVVQHTRLGFRHDENFSRAPWRMQATNKRRVIHEQDGSSASRALPCAPAETRSDSCTSCCSTSWVAALRAR